MQQTLDWQHHGYGMDSGIQSGATTQVSQVISISSNIQVNVLSLLKLEAILRYGGAIL